LHVTPQLVPSHVAVPFAIEAHGVHDAPHVSTEVLLAHVLPHAW
jgi:hypothetical protein